MKRLNKLVAVLCVVAALAACSSEAFAKSGDAKKRLVSGSIVRVDRDARAIVVRDSATNREVVVRVPSGASIKTGYLSGSLVSFELLLRGMSVRDLAVE